ncbi:MAG TPA: cellobiose phosphorylase [Clostridiales bacterium]|nr:cellobiose phosphorylase [Clostridiales bacterium]
MGFYHLDGDIYTIENYDTLPAFSSFLPGLAGIKGIPIWVYYTNRGQGVNSFGIHNKNNAIMEFNPANTAYENTPIKGFRTFIKCDGQYFEPFFTLDKSAKRRFLIKENSFAIEEVNTKYGLKIHIKYVVLPEENVGALLRQVTVENIGDKTRDIEIIDGLPKIIPYGISNGAYKEMSNLLKSWSDIKNIDNNVPYYTMRSSSDDSSEVKEIQGGYFYLTIRDGKVEPVIYDTEVIFDYDSSLVNPISFMDNSVEELKSKKQCFYNKVPCGFTPLSFSLEPSAKTGFHTLVGFAGSVEQINDKIHSFCQKDYFADKIDRADDLVEHMLKDVRTKTSSPIFDKYIRQNYLDNFLRGGYPFVFNKDSNKSIVHLFSRKHGDPERDYNFFTTAGEYYSQGNGNFRDVNQNRRNDVFFNKDIEDFNIKTFFQLIQIDGYNPLEVRPSTFSIKVDKRDAANELLEKATIGDIKPLEKIVAGSFTPGQISNCIAINKINLSQDEDEFLEMLLELCDDNIEAGFGEGYWSDHWDYNMDLVENYLKVYPDKRRELLFEDDSYRFYDSPVYVLPRIEKYVINSKGEVRQYGSIMRDKKKLACEGFIDNGSNWLKTEDGSYGTTTLIGKMISLGLNKYASLDAFGMGVEMEGGKPGWNDAMNGLPGLFGSGMSETLELKRLVTFIINNVAKADEIRLPIEINDYLLRVYAYTNNLLNKEMDNFTYWDTVATIREEYREEVRYSLKGKYATVDTSQVKEIFEKFQERIDEGINRALDFGDGIIPTYFTFNADKFEAVVDKDGNPVPGYNGLAKVMVKSFEPVPLPYFLEGPAKMLASLKDSKEAEKLYKNVKESELYDRKLGMYKTSVPIDHISMENGRIRAFTAGWLERESIFLHMEYKYLLSTLEAGLYEEFYKDLPTAMVAFRDPEEYGRSILENSSFIASSVNPNEAIHGRGYVARLSGSTSEAISIWMMMFMGDKLFSYENNELVLHLEPKLPGWLFDEDDNASFTLLSSCKVTYHNPSRRDIYGQDSPRIEKIRVIDTGEVIEGSYIKGELASRIRDGKVKELVVEFENL